MISPLDKIKTLIEYAKFGEFQCRKINGEAEIDECFFPRAITKHNDNWNNNYTIYAKKISGYLKIFGGTACLSSNKKTVEIDLPYCITLSNSSQPWSNNESNDYTKIIKLPSVRSFEGAVFKGLRALEYLELGALTLVSNTAFYGCDSLTEFYVKEGTTAALYLQQNPLITQECLHKLIENYADMTGVNAPMLHLGEVNLAKIDDEHIAMLNTKNINYK